MATKIRIKAKKIRKEKFTRFPISRQTEILLASVGVVLLLVTSILLMAYYAPKIWGKGSSVSKVEKAALASRAVHLANLKTRGIVLGEIKERESLLVDIARWKALSFKEQQDGAAAGADLFPEDRCFVVDAASGEGVGYYTRRGGYQARVANGKEH